jgi:CheY-like chemotaxis protein/GGDEF domain-containing protein
VSYQQVLPYFHPISMTDVPVAPPPPLALLVGDQDWLAVTVGAAAATWGFSVVRADSRSQALHVAEVTNPDLVLIDLWMRRGRGQEWMERLVGQLRMLAPATPVLAVTADTLSRPDLIAVLAAGAWDVVELPVDTAVLRHKVNAWLAAKRHADRLTRTTVHWDDGKLYNLHGLLHRARELGAEAARGRDPLCCVAIRTDVVKRARPRSAPGIDDAHHSAWIREAWSATGRASDVVGRAGRSRFAILAPRTGLAGGRQLADRFVRAVTERAGAGCADAAVLALEPALDGADDAVALLGRTLALLEQRRRPTGAAH